MADLKTYVCHECGEFYMNEGKALQHKIETGHKSISAFKSETFRIGDKDFRLFEV